MGGTIAIIIILLLVPVVLLMSMTGLAAALGGLVNRDVDITHEGSELLQVAESGSSLLTQD